MITKQKQLELDLAEAKKALNRICEVLHSDDYSYPEKVGASKGIAGATLDILGDGTWAKRFEAWAKQPAPPCVDARQLLLKFDA